MSKKNLGKSKGHRVEDAVFHIPFYTGAFFDQATAEEGEILSTTATPSTVHIPVKIMEDGSDNRGNLTSFKMKHIQHFDNNVEEVLLAIATLDERLVKRRKIKDETEKIRTHIHLMHIICAGTAEQTYNEAKKAARQFMYDTYILDIDDDSTTATEDILVTEETEFYKYLEKDHSKDLNKKDFKDTKAYTLYLYRRYYQAFWNHLHSVIFGVNAYRAFEQQRDYMMMHIVKPFGISVEAAFRHIDIMVNLLAYFPPPFSKGKTATNSRWEEFEDIKKISQKEATKMKYRLLPKSFHQRFDELEADWTEMSYSKFLAEAQKCEIKDQRDRNTQTKSKELLKRKRKLEDDSLSTLSRSQKGTNYKAKKARQPKEKTSASTARFCVLCKTAGAPPPVFTSHNTEDCKRTEQYAAAMSSSVNNRKKPVREYRSTEQQLRRELKLLTKINKLKGHKRTKRSNKSADGDVDMSSVSSNDDMSY